jgi:hypothetical protein
MKCFEGGGLRANGEPCHRDVKPGFTRCSLHGGQKAGAKIKAELALAVLRVPSIEALHLIIDQFLSDTCPTCNYPKGDAEEKRVIVSTARTILDRTGMGPTSKLELTSQHDGAVNLDLLTTDEKATLLAALAQVRAIKDALRTRQAGPEDDHTSTAQVH